MENNWNHVLMCDNWQATTTGLSTLFICFSSHHFKTLNYESDIFNVSNVSGEEMCSVLTTKSVSLILKPKFKEPIKYPMHSIKHEIFIHRLETAREEG